MLLFIYNFRVHRNIRKIFMDHASREAQETLLPKEMLLLQGSFIKECGVP